jgi:hypothetical protein
MKDDAIRHRPAEREALIARGVRAFCLTNAQLQGEEQARRLVDNGGKFARVCGCARGDLVSGHSWACARDCAVAG